MRKPALPQLVERGEERPGQQRQTRPPAPEAGHQEEGHEAVERQVQRLVRTRVAEETALGQTRGRGRHPVEHDRRGPVQTSAAAGPAGAPLSRPRHREPAAEREEQRGQLRGVSPNQQRSGHEDRAQPEEPSAASRLSQIRDDHRADHRLERIRKARPQPKADRQRGPQRQQRCEPRDSRAHSPAAPHQTPTACGSRSTASSATTRTWVS